MAISYEQFEAAVCVEAILGELSGGEVSGGNCPGGIYLEPGNICVKDER